MDKKTTFSILPGIMYFYVHFVVEVVSFYFLNSIVGNDYILWLAPFIYDVLAFVPQILLGAISDRFSRIPFGLIGMLLLVVGLCLMGMNVASPILLTIVIALGNACVHVNGAEVTLRSGRGRITPAAVFVAGGSFGVVTGKLLAGSVPIWPLLLLVATTIPVIVFAERYRRQTEKIQTPCKQFNFASRTMAVWLVALLAAIVVAIRGYVGYGIPTSWNKTIPQTILLFSFMGIGKALGGILTDTIGIRKTACISMLGAIPFLLYGDNNMVISLIGVMFFSMTMAITLAVLVSVFPETPGFAFGVTTVGLALGSLPFFFFRIESFVINSIIIVASSFICLAILLTITRRE